MHRITTLLLSIALATACSKKSDKPADNPPAAAPAPAPADVTSDEFTDAMAKIADYTKQMCACTDLDCAKRVDGEEDTWEKAAKHGKKPDDAQLAQWNKAKDDYRACRDKAGNAGSAPAQ